MLLPLDQPAELLDRADRAMYARKAARQRRILRAGSDSITGLTANLPPLAQCATFARCPNWTIWHGMTALFQEESYVEIIWP